MKKRDLLHKWLMQEKRQLAFLLGLFFLGIAAGSIYAGQEPDYTQVRSTLGNLFSAYMLQGTSIKSAFLLSLWNHLVPGFFLWISGWHRFLLPLGLFQILLSGFRCGYSVSLLCQCYGGKGILLSLISVLPPTLLLVPALCLYGTAQLQFALDRGNLKKVSLSHTVRKQIYLRHILMTALFLVLMVICALTDGYLVPLLLKPLCGLFL